MCYAGGTQWLLNLALDHICTVPPISNIPHHPALSCCVKLSDAV